MRVFILFLSFTSGSMLWATGKASLEDIDALVKSNRVALNKLNRSLHDKMQMAFQEPDRTVEKQIKALVDKRGELLARQEFYDRLKFQWMSHYRSGNPKGFLMGIFQKLALYEAKSQNGKTHLWRLYSYLGYAIKEFPEHGENLILFIQSYLEYSSVTNPKPPEGFGRLRDYRNGKKSVHARGTPKDQLGEVLESKLGKRPRTQPVSNTPVVDQSSLKVSTKLKTIE